MTSFAPRRCLLVLLLALFSRTIALAAAPALTCEVANGQATLSWPVTAFSYALESTSDLTAGVWSAVATAPVETDGTLAVTLPLTPKAAFYRLRWTNAEPRIYLWTNPDDEDLRQLVRGSYGYPSNTTSAFGAVATQDLVGAVGNINILDASSTQVPGTDHSQLTYSWRFFYPESRNGGVGFFDLRNRILGTNTATVTLLPNALADLGSVVGANEWRVFLTITNHAGPTPKVTQFRFRFRYLGSALTVQQSSHP
jgi:hypothetical protein